MDCIKKIQNMKRKYQATEEKAVLYFEPTGTARSPRAWTPPRLPSFPSQPGSQMLPRTFPARGGCKNMMRSMVLLKMTQPQQLWEK